MSDLFEGIISQGVDGKGKTQMLNYNDLSLIISPIAPLALPINNKPILSTVENALSFIRKKKLKIVAQIVDNDILKGIKVEEGSHNLNLIWSYIPVIESRTLIKGVEKGQIYSDILPNDESALTKMRNNRKIAEYLKQYVLFLYAQNPLENAETFSDRIVVKSNHKYDLQLLDKQLTLNYIKGGFIDKKGRLIASSDEIKTHLLSYLEVNLLNNKEFILSYKDKKRISEHYQLVSDFKVAANQLIFMNKDSLIHWKNNVNNISQSRSISKILNSISQEPYFFRLKDGTGDVSSLCIIQNVKDGNKDLAINVSKYWIDTRANMGYNPDTILDNPETSYRVYNINGEYINEKKGKYPILSYDEDLDSLTDKTIYAAILFL